MTLVVDLPRWLAAVLLAAGLSALTASPAASQSTPSKKELVARIVQLQMRGVEQLAQSLVERPAALMLKDASQAMTKRIPADQQEAAGQRIQDSAKRYVTEASPLVRARAVSLAPQVFGPHLEANFSAAELAQVLAWLESPVALKYHQALPGVQDSFMQKLVADSRPLVDPKLLKLEQEIRSALGLPPVNDSPLPNRPAAGDAGVNRK